MNWTQGQEGPGFDELKEKWYKQFMKLSCLKVKAWHQEQTLCVCASECVCMCGTCCSALDPGLGQSTGSGEKVHEWCLWILCFLSPSQRTLRTWQAEVPSVSGEENENSPEQCCANLSIILSKAKNILSGPVLTSYCWLNKDLPQIQITKLIVAL